MIGWFSLTSEVQTSEAHPISGSCLRPSRCCLQTLSLFPLNERETSGFLSLSHTHTHSLLSDWLLSHSSPSPLTVTANRKRAVWFSSHPLRESEHRASFSHHTGLNDQRFVLSCRDSVQHNNKTTITCLELSREYTSARSYLFPVQHTSARSNIRLSSFTDTSSDPGSIL